MVYERPGGTGAVSVLSQCQLLPWRAWRRASALIAAHRRLFSDIGTMRSLPWKAPGNTCNSVGTPGLVEALCVFDVLI